jgi:outer membrane biosynthesis protein TonB
MKSLIIFAIILLGSITLYGQEKPVAPKKQPTETQIKEVPKNSPNPDKTTKVQQQKKQVKTVQMRQQKANQTRDRQKAIQRRINHK